MHCQLEIKTYAKHESHGHKTTVHIHEAKPPGQRRDRPAARMQANHVGIPCFYQLVIYAIEIVCLACFSEL